MEIPPKSKSLLVWMIKILSVRASWCKILKKILKKLKNSRILPIICAFFKLCSKGSPIMLKLCFYAFNLPNYANYAPSTFRQVQILSER